MENVVQDKLVRILFVDDEENILQSLRRLTIDEDFEVMTAISGEKALEILKDDKDIGIIVSDQRMPGMTGVEFLEKSREIQTDAIRIILTGYADIKAAVDAINKGGAYRYISKPWKDEELLQVLRDTAQRYLLAVENKRISQIIKKQNEELKNWNSQLEIMVQEQTIDIQNQNKKLQELNEKLKKNFKNFIEAFSNLIEMRDKTVSGHSKNVAIISRHTAISMSLSDQDISNIFIAALLHDIGKIGIPDSILIKPVDSLVGYERMEYEQHPVRGQVTVDSIEGFRDIGIYIRHHHENIDGSGFPDGLRGNDIPLGSRIIAIADALDRASSVFSSKSKDYEKVLKELELYLDKKFDRTVFKVIKDTVLEKFGTIAIEDHSEFIEVHPGQLVEGMVLLREVRSGTGLLLLAKGVVLDKKSIEALQRYHQIDPLKEGIFVKKSYMVTKNE
ncbi:MAG: HD domain-containing phosphohydrolase [Thermodesulfovibrionales bacterium]